MDYVKLFGGIDVRGKKIAVAMSGGVDSSVCAYLLKKAGAEVIGVTMMHIPGSKCCDLGDISRARYLAHELGFLHHIIDLKEPFEKKVVQYFVDETKLGRNPNPCVVCNQEIKFGLLFEAAQKLGAEYMATGHYARIEHKGKKIILKRPVDTKKDQSYVLSMLPRPVLQKVLFPIGNFTKDKVRAIAKKAKLTMHDRPGNQDLCFLHGEKGCYIEEWEGKKAVPGEIVDELGNVLGKHLGIVHYSIGQRRGLGLRNQNRLYVTQIDSKKNRLIVGNDKKLYSNEFFMSGCNWVSIDAPKRPIKAEILVRNKAFPQKVTIQILGKRVKITAKEPIFGVAPGQIAAFIRKDVVLGGGWID